MTAAMKGGKLGGRSVSCPGPTTAPAKRASTTPYGRVLAMIVRISGAGIHTGSNAPRAQRSTTQPQNQPAPIPHPRRRRAGREKSRRGRLPSRPPAKTGVPDTRSGCTQGVSQPARTFHRRHSPFKSPAQRIIRARSHLRSSTEPPCPCLMFVVESSPCFGSGLPI
jgi:hypothetical protein